MEANLPQSPEIQRPTLLRTLETTLSGETQAVVLEGSEGMGKTTLLRQFTASFPGRAFGVFLSSASRWAYDPDMTMRDLAAEMSEVVRGQPLREDEPDRRLFGRFITELDRKARRSGKPFYILIDGLEEIPEAEAPVRDQIVSLLPFGYPGFRFILTGDINVLPLSQAARARTKPSQIIYFTPDESSRYLNGLDLTAAQLDEIYAVTRGVPGYLASVRRRLLRTDSTAKILGSLPELMHESFVAEWRAVSHLSPSCRLVLATLAHQPSMSSLQALSQLVGEETRVVQVALQGLPFVRVSPDSAEFVSESFRKFAAGELIELRTEVWDLLINRLLVDPDSEESLRDLSGIYAAAGRDSDLIDYLSPERLARLVHRTPSILSVNRRTGDAIQASRRLKRDADFVRFSLQHSAIQDIAGDDTRVNEVRAISALGDHEAAIGLANEVPRLSMRLRLLCAIARVRRDHGLQADAELNTQVRTIYEQVDPAELKDVAPGLAADMFAVSPELATDFLSRIGNEGSENALDWALARLSVQALVAEKTPKGRETARQISDRIADPAAKRLSLQAVALVGGWTARDVIAEAGKFHSTAEKMFLLQKWMWANRQRPDALEVLEVGLSTALSATGYSVTADVIRELSFCLPYTDAVQSVTYFVQQIDSLGPELERIGPPEEFIRLQLVLARAVWRHDRVEARTRFEEAYNAITRIGDLAIRMGSLARLVASLLRADPDRTIPEADELRALPQSELKEGVEKLLATTADHLEAARRIINALAVPAPNDALGVIRLINTEYRRDEAYVEFIESALLPAVSEMPVSFIIEAIGQIVDPRIRDRATHAIVDNLRVRPLPIAELELVEPLLALVTRMNSPALRAQGCARVLAVLRRERTTEGFKPSLRAFHDSLASEMRRAWRTLDDDAGKLDNGLDIIVATAQSVPDVAREYVDEVNRLKATVALPEVSAGQVAFDALRLAVRALGGLIRHSQDSEADKERILKAIKRSGSIRGEAILMAELSLRYALANRHNDAAELVQSNLVPLLESIPPDAAFQKNVLVSDVAAALHTGARATAETWFAAMPPVLRDDAWEQVALFHLRKAVPWDPYEQRAGPSRPLSIEDVNTIVQATSHIDEDASVYYFIDEVVDAVLAPGALFKASQRLVIAKQLTSLADSKFPSVRFIRHQGYVVASRSRINRLNPQSPAVPFDRLFDDAMNLPNTADQAHVLAIIASDARTAKERTKCVNEAKHIADSLPTLGDRLDHYQTIIEQIRDVDEGTAKKLLEEAIRLALTGVGDSIDKRRRSLIELACRHFPDAASSMAALADDDPAKRSVDAQLRLYRLRDSLAPRRKGGELPSTRNSNEWSKASWLKLGSLVAGKAAPIPMNRAIALLDHAIPQPLSEAFPLFAWFIENLVHLSQSAAATREAVRPVFDACLLGSELAQHAASRPAFVKRFEVVEPFEDNSVLVGAGERQQGIDFLREWLGDCRDCSSIVIVEPYFKEQAVELLTIIADICPDSMITVLAGRKESIGDVNEIPEAAYRAAWRRLRSEEPPACRLLFVQTRETRKFPFHDRWWIGGNSAVHLGTSYGGVGIRISRLSRLDINECRETIARVTPYVDMTAREYDGERLEYALFML